jgi:hypothetical protein
MAEKNTAAAARARWSRKENRGRPLGSTELLPRRRTGDKRRGTTALTLEDQLKIAREELGLAYRRIEDLESQLGVGHFDGDTRAFLTAVMRGEYLASPQQIYSARALLPVEYPPAVSLDGRSVEQIKAEAIRERAAEAEPYRALLIAEIDRLAAVGEAAQERKWRTLVERGVITEEQAMACRAMLDAEDDVREVRPSEIIPPSMSVAIRKRPPVEIDAEDAPEGAAESEAGEAEAAETPGQDGWGHPCIAVES